jgi:hypothetical protein
MVSSSAASTASCVVSSGVARKNGADGGRGGGVDTGAIAQPHDAPRSTKDTDHQALDLIGSSYFTLD